MSVISDFSIFLKDKKDIHPKQIEPGMKLEVLQVFSSSEKKYCLFQRDEKIIFRRLDSDNFVDRKNKEVVIDNVLKNVIIDLNKDSHTNEIKESYYVTGVLFDILFEKQRQLSLQRKTLYKMIITSTTSIILSKIISFSFLKIIKK